MQVAHAKVTQRLFCESEKGSASHGRTVRPNLPIIPEIIPLSETACGMCGLEYSLFADEESDIIEIEVAAHVRRIRRQKCARGKTTR